MPPEELVMDIQYHNAPEDKVEFHRMADGVGQAIARLLTDYPETADRLAFGVAPVIQAWCVDAACTRLSYSVGGTDDYTGEDFRQGVELICSMKNPEDGWSVTRIVVTVLHKAADHPVVLDMYTSNETVMSLAISATWVNDEAPQEEYLTATQVKFYPIKNKQRKVRAVRAGGIAPQ